MQSVLIVIPKRFVVSHKLALIVYHLLSTREAYNESVFHRCDEEALKRARCRLRRQAAQLGFQLIRIQNG